MDGGPVQYLPIPRTNTIGAAEQPTTGNQGSIEDGYSIFWKGYRRGTNSETLQKKECDYSYGISAKQTWNAGSDGLQNSRTISIGMLRIGYIHRNILFTSVAIDKENKII